MSNKVSISNEQCLTEEQLLRYAEGAMTRDEERAVDRHIGTCDMCSDAVEGAMMIPASDFKKHSASIGDKIDKTYDKVSDKNLLEKPLNMEGVKEIITPTLKPVRSLRLLRWVTVAAASVLVLATAGVWLLTTDAPTNQDAKSASAETAIEATPPQYPTAEPLLDTVSSTPSGNLNESNNSGYVASTPTKAPQMASKPVPPNDNTFADVETEVKKDNAPTPPVSFSSSPKPTVQPTENQAVKEEDAKDMAVDSDKKMEQETAYRQSAEAAKSKAKTKMDDRVASSNAPSKTYPATGAAPASAKMVSADEQYFQKGVTYFNQQDYGNALTNLNKVKPEKVNSDLYQQVQWLSAMAQLKQGNKSTAKSILETIVVGKGKYAAQAAEVLRTSF